jgi:DNA-binding transcriptional LysR family regulator
MEFRHVRYFMAVAEERSFTLAAARLNIAQSPLSQQIRKLEREIDVELFTRTTRSVSLTPAGEVFYERMRAMLALTEDAVDTARKTARGESGRLSIGFTGSATYELLPALVRAFHDRHPDVTLDVHSEMFTKAQVDGLMAGELDVGLLRPPARAEGLVLEVLREEPLVALLPSSHPATVTRSVQLSSLRDDWFICHPPGPVSNMHATVLAACERAGFTPRIRHVISNTAALVALVAAGLGVAVVPASLRHLGINGATYRPLAPPVTTVPLALAYRGESVSPLVRRFVETARVVVVSRAHLPAARRLDVEGPTTRPPDEDDYFSLPL